MKKLVVYFTVFLLVLGVAYALCSDGVLNAGEECDDNNLRDNDGCSSSCRLEVPSCGNGILESGEECDVGVHPDCAEDCTRLTKLCAGKQVPLTVDCQEPIVEEEACPPYDEAVVELGLKVSRVALDLGLTEAERVDLAHAEVLLLENRGCCDQIDCASLQDTLARHNTNPRAPLVTGAVVGTPTQQSNSVALTFLVFMVTFFILVILMPQEQKKRKPRKK